MGPDIPAIMIMLSATLLARAHRIVNPVVTTHEIPATVDNAAEAS